MIKDTIEFKINAAIERGYKLDEAILRSPHKKINPIVN
jgi:hypothetical protein